MNSAAALLVVLALVGSAAGSTIYISPFGNDSGNFSSRTSPFRSLQYALSTAKDGDAVVVLRGTYSGAKNFVKFPVSVSLSADDGDASKFIFDAQSTSGNRLTIPDSTSVSITGLTLRGGTSSYGIIDLEGQQSSLFVSDCVFRSNQYAIVLEGGSLTVHDSVFLGNDYDVRSTNNFDHSYSRMIQLQNVTMSQGKTAFDLSSWPLSLELDSVTVNNKSIAINFVSGSDGIDVNIVRSTFFYNTEVIVASSSSSGQSHIRIKDSEFYSNGGDGINGAVIFASLGMSVDVSNSKFHDNSARPTSSKTYGMGGVVYCDQGAVINIQGGSMIDNYAYDGGAGYCMSDCSFLADDVYTYGNHDDQHTSPCRGL